MACVAYGCKSRSNVKSDEDRNLSFHRFPADEKLRDVWVKAVHRKNWKPSKHSRLCSKHFESNCYLDEKKRKVLCRDAVPTIFKSYPTYLQKESRKLARNKIIDFQRKLRNIRNLQPGLDQPSTSSGSHAPSVTTDTESLTEPHIDDTPRKKKLKKIIAKQSKTSLQRQVYKDLSQHSIDQWNVDNHRNLLIKAIAEHYLKLRIHYMTKQLIQPEERVCNF